MSRGWSRGSTRAWRRLRAQVLLANLVEHGGACQLAIPSVCTGTADCVHHRHGRRTTGDDPRFLIAACTACNLKVGDPANNSTSDPAGRSATRW